MSNPYGPPPGGGGGWGPPPQQQQPQGFGSPPQQGFGPPQQGFGPPIQQPPPINADLALFIGLGVALFCGCLPGGLIAIYLADQAKKAAARGDIGDAQSKLRMAHITNAVSVGIMFLIPCLYFAFVILLGGMGAALG